jgi:hypothetical protein
MADVTVVIDEAAIAAMARSWDSPVGEAVMAATERVEDWQRFTAPISPRGSRYAPPGFLKSRITSAEPVHHDADNVILGLAGTRTNRHGGAYSYPLAFISSDSGWTANRGGRSKRRAANRFITDAIAALDSFVYEVP